MTCCEIIVEPTNARRVDGGRGAIGMTADGMVITAKWWLGAWWRNESAGCAMRFCREYGVPTR